MSEFVKWSHANCIGKAHIDGQRKHLFQLGERVLNLLESASHDQSQKHEVLNDIVESMRSCFASEERLLESNQCPYLEKHVLEHRAFMERLIDMLMRSQMGSFDLNQLQAVCSDWANRHVPNMDVRCKNCGFTIFHTPDKIESACMHRTVEANW